MPSLDRSPYLIRHHSLFVVAIVLAATVAAAQTKPLTPPADLDAYVARAMKTFEVP